MYDVIVLGMGAAGCAAAAELRANNMDVLVLEATNHVGGRINTARIGNSVVELGAEWIHGSVNNSVFKLASRNGVNLQPQDLVYKVFTSNGCETNPKLIKKLMEFTFKLMDQPPPSPEPLGNYISRRVKEYAISTNPVLEHDKIFVNNFLRWIKLIIGIKEGCAHWNDVTTHTEFEELGGHNHLSWHKYGYDALLNIIMHHYVNEPQRFDYIMNKEVIEINLPPLVEDCVKVTCKDGTVYKAAAVIVTFSLGVLKEKHESLFKPPLPANNIKAIQEISFGLVNKVVLFFDEIWWPTDVSCLAFLWRPEDIATISDVDKWITNIYGASISTGTEKCLVFWTNYVFVESMPEDILKLKLVGLLRKFITNIVIPEPTLLIRSCWYNNPFTRGSYSYDNINTPSYSHARFDLSMPIYDSEGKLRLMFAGEATNSRHFATVHGAVESGKREASRFLVGRIDNY